MKIRMFYPSMVSEWNFAGAGFLRGMVSEFLHRGEDVKVFEPVRSECIENLVACYGDAPVKEFKSFYNNRLISNFYETEKFQPEEILDDCDLVIVHVRTDPEIIRKIGEHRKANPFYKLLFHDSSHKVMTEKEGSVIASLQNYDGVLAGCNYLREMYLKNGWADKAWVWHEAVDSRIFYPRESESKEGDLVCVGNWGNGERFDGLKNFFLKPAERLQVSSTLYGVGYPEDFIKKCDSCNITFKEWIAAYKIPHVFAGHSVAVHIPKKSYLESVPGKPANGIFEAMACGIPVVSAPWEDTDGLFAQGLDYIVADAREIESKIQELLLDKERAAETARNGLRVINKKHTCWHRLKTLFKICRQLGMEIQDELGGRREQYAA
ncbi:glycosyltransferase [Cytophagaceae bacterium ABcell3]|nr:glycosyltransferase [Cytophagaceae bacterium ABcell3]